MNFRQAVLLTIGIIMTVCAYAQSPSPVDDTAPDLSPSLSSKYLDKVSSKANQLEQKLDKQTVKALQQWQKQEARIKRKLARTDSLKAAAIFGNAEQQYKQLEQKLQSKTSLQQYIPSLDSISSSLKFLQQNPRLLSNAKGAQQKLSDAASKVNGMEGKFQKAEEIKKWIKERKQLLKEQLVNMGFAKELKKLNKQAFYYSERLNEYKSLLKDHTKAERKALELLRQSKLFTNFMRKNSMLASLFRLPGDDPSSFGGAGGGSLAGLQTRAQINGLIQQQIAAGGPNAQQQFQQNIQEAQSQLSQLKDKITQLGSGNSDTEMPEGFKKNNQRVKSFWKKWEAGFNIQSNRSNGVYPVSSDVGLSVGFRPHDNFVVGLGFAGRIGWGKNIRHINFTYSGISVRSFSELKIKGTFHAVAGFEMNYRPEIRTIEQLKDKSGWQPSGLVGLSKVVSLKTKFFKKTKIQLMFDLLSYRQLPRTNPILFRIGYNF